MDKATLETMANALRVAELERKAMPALTTTHAGLSIEDAYAVQMLNVRKRVTEGGVVVGKKVGLTSKPMQEFLGVNEPDFGHIFRCMVFDAETPVMVSRFLQPKVEAELAFVLAQDLQGPGITVSDVFACTKAVVPAFEIIASRIADWKISIQDTIADNGSSAGMMLGTTHTAPQVYDLSSVELVLEKNGKPLDTAVGAAVMGNPATAVAWLANALGKHGIALQKGEVILSGSFAKAYEVAPGDAFTAHFGPLGAVKISFIP